MWPFDSMFGGGVPNINSVSDPGAMSIGAMQNLAATDLAANPPTMAIPYQNGPYYTMNSTPFAGSTGGGLLSGLGGMNLGGMPTMPQTPQAQAAPASQPQGGGGMGNVQIPNPFQTAPRPLNPETGQPSPYAGPPPPLGPAAGNPMLMDLLKQRLGVGG